MERSKVKIDAERLSNITCRCRCEICGSEYDERKWYHDGELVQICFKCYHAHIEIIFIGCSIYDWWSVDGELRDMRKRATQISTAIRFIEKEIKNERTKLGDPWADSRPTRLEGRQDYKYRRQYQSQGC